MKHRLENNAEAIFLPCQVAESFIYPNENNPQGEVVQLILHQEFFFVLKQGSSLNYMLFVVHFKNIL